MAEIDLIAASNSPAEWTEKSIEVTAILSIVSVDSLFIETIDRIAVTSIDFSVHSAGELDAAIKSISAIKSVDEVHRVDIE